MLAACGGGGSSGGDDNDEPREVDQAPIAQIVPVTDRQLTEVCTTLDGSGSRDPNGSAITYAWSLTSAPATSAASVTSPDQPTAEICTDIPGDYTIELIVDDGNLLSAPASISFTAYANSAPIANAGTDQVVDLSATVTLDGTGSTDVDSQTLSYQWSFMERPAGSNATLSSATVVRPTFDVDLPGDYRLTLVVNDGLVDSASDEVLISTHNVPPVANAGSDIGGRQVGDTVTLDGSASSDLDGDSLTYAWAFTSRPDGSNATLTGATTAMPSFIVDVRGDYQIALVVNDGTSDSAADSVTVSVGNTAPIADAGSNQTVDVGDPVVLSGAGSSDADGDVLSFTWSFNDRPAGSNAQFTATNTVNSGFTPDLAGDYVVQLQVSDGALNASDTVTISATLVPVNNPPVANAGADQSLSSIALVTLDGGESADADGDSLTYQWSFTDIPVGSNAVLTGADTQTPAFTPDLNGLYVVQLIVNDGELSSTPDVVNVALNVNTRPVAVISGEQARFLGQPILLDGSGSTDADGNELSYSWSVTSHPVGAVFSFSDATAASTVLSGNLPGDYLVQLIVNDGQQDSAPQTLTIAVSDGDQDGDGLLSSLELTLGLDPNDADTGSTGTPDGMKDYDNDDLPNRWELILGYDITKPDTDDNGTLDGDEDLDGDGFSNKDEIAFGTDPADPNSAPFSFIVKQTPVVPGGRIDYVIHVSNLNLTSALVNTTVKLTVPTGVSFFYNNNTNPNPSAITGCGGTTLCNAGAEVFWDLGNLQPGESRTIEINATVAAGVTPGTLIQTPVSISADGLGDAITLTRTAAVVASQPVFFALTASKDPVAPGESFTYELDLGNSNNTALNGAQISLALPAGLTVDAISDGGSQNGNTISWNIGSLVPAAAVKRSVSVTLDGAAVEASLLTSVAQLRHDGGLELDRELHDTISVSAPLPLEISYTLLDSPVLAGGLMRYRINISNVNTVSIVNNVQVLVRVPNDVSFRYNLDAEPDATTITGCSGTTVCSAGAEVFWNLGNLQPGDSRTIEIAAAVSGNVAPGTLIQAPLSITATGIGDMISMKRTVAVTD